MSAVVWWQRLSLLLPLRQLPAQHTLQGQGQGEGYDKGRQWRKLVDGFELMQAAGVAPDDYTYNSPLVSAYDKGEQRQKAEEAFELLQAAEG